MSEVDNTDRGNEIDGFNPLLDGSADRGRSPNPGRGGLRPSGVARGGVVEEDALDCQSGAVLFMTTPLL